ncbi:GumC family protein [Bacteroides heparinolyticus]|uniref:GumC family protein n=1 Tax=Prevotella heparinolytica TaxID=28113 RepID=UPI0035A0DD3E
MDIVQFISQFFYRIRYWLVWGSLLVTIVVIYFTQFLPFTYTVNSQIYAGVTNEANLDGSRVVNVGSTFDNLINIAKSKSTLEKVSLRLLATNLVHGEEWNDNQYIKAKHYRQLLRSTPKEVLALVDRNSVEKTTENLQKYRKENGRNFVYAMFSRPVPFYGHNALKSIDIKRLDNSDLLNISYTCGDPGIAQNTVKLVEDELLKAYEILRFSATNNVIAYFEEQVRLAKEKLTQEEDDLMNYNVAKQVINYDEQTKALAITKYEVDDREEQATRTYESAMALRKMLEDKMDIRAKIIRDNTNLLQQLEKITNLNQNILEEEIFTSDKNYANNEKLTKNKTELKKTEQAISHLSDNLNEYNFTKEGVGIENMVNEWLLACINEAKAKSELKVLKDRRDDIFSQFQTFSPVGTQVKRKERAVGIAEDTYRQQLHGLSEAHLRLQNIKMTTANLQVIAPPDFPLEDNGRKRMFYIIVAFVSSLVFISAYFLIIELLDRTLRDAERSHRLTGLPVIAAFNGISNLKFRGFLKACNRRAAAYSCRQLNKYLAVGRPTVINLFSMEEREGKSFLAKYFIDYWRTENLNVRLVKAGVEFETDTQTYVQARQLSDFWQLNSAEQTPDIILVEYPAASVATLPLAVIKQADFNLLIANAARLWGKDDDVRLKSMREVLGDTPMALYLNNADRDVVESFTGELPPRTLLHSFFTRLAQLGLTSKRAAVK